MAKNSVKMKSVLSGLVTVAIAIFGLLAAGTDGATHSPSSSRRGNYSYEDQSSRTPTVASPSNLDPVFRSKEPKYHHEEAGHGPSKRSGIGIEKAPPDLQFGLAFTVPFVSLSTEKLLHQVSGSGHGHRGHNSLADILSVLKLNVGGLVVAAVVGVAALLFLPAIFPWKLPSLFNGGGGGHGGGGYGGFMPGFLENIMPGLGLTKPLGYGQSYEHNPYQYGNGNDNYGAYSQRKEQDGKSRSLDNDRNGTVPTFWGEVYRTVQSTVVKAETCATFAMCERGRESLKNRTATAGERRGSRKIDEPPSNAGSTFDHLLETVTELGGDRVPGLSQLQKAYQAGLKGVDCGKQYKKCPISAEKLDGMIKDVGSYIFS